jgi:hypothetical protein
MDVSRTRPSIPPGPDRLDGGVSRVFAWTLVVVIALAVAGASLAQIDVVAVAEGKVIPSARVKRIRPYESGIVRAIRVEDGQAVRAGDVLVELDPTVRLAERARLLHAVRASALDVARLRAMRDRVDAAREPAPDRAARVREPRRKLLRRVLPRLPKQIDGRHGNQRHAVYGRLTRIRKLRNRVFHHERILHWTDLERQHSAMVETLAWISPEIQSLAPLVDRFPQVYALGAAPYIAHVRQTFVTHA